MKRLGALALVAVVFLLGLAAGVLGDRLAGPRWGRERPHRGGPPALEGYFLGDDLELTADQQERLDEVFRRQRRKFEQLHSDIRPQVEDLMEETRGQVEEILTPEQLERYRRRPDRWHRRLRHHDRHDHPLDGDP